MVVVLVPGLKEGGKGGGKRCGIPVYRLPVFYPGTATCYRFGKSLVLVIQRWFDCQEFKAGARAGFSCELQSPMARRATST